jgi:ATP-dependent protease ClpP protease subunit
VKLKITNAGTDRPALWLYGEIGSSFGGITADDFRIALTEVSPKQDIDLHIHSEGGEFTDSIAMHSMLVRRPGKVHGIVDGRAYSGGSVVAMGCTTVEMARGSWMMIHEAHGSLREGGAKDFRDSADQLDATNGQLVDIYSKRWKGTPESLVAALRAETWLKDQDAVDFGLADTVAESMAVAAYVSPDERARFNFHRVPDELSKPDIVFPVRSKAEERLAEILG